MRNKIVEGKPLNIARKYQDKIITQKDQKDTERVGERQNTMETQPKEGAYDDFIQFYYGRKNHDKITTQINHKKDKIENQMSTIERNHSELLSQNRESRLHRTRQIQNESHCIMMIYRLRKTRKKRSVIPKVNPLKDTHTLTIPGIRKIQRTKKTIQ